MERVKALPLKPAEYLELADTLLREPTMEAARALMEALEDFHDWKIGGFEAMGQYIADAELNWLDGRPPLSDS
jgi:hypothetical protein